MAEKKITELPQLTVADASDLIPIVDSSANITKRVLASGIVPDGAVTTGKLSDSATTTDKIADSAVTTAKLVNLAVTSGKIANDAVTSAKLAPGITIDSNGYRVVDLGTLKIFSKTFTATTSVGGSSSVNVLTLNHPAGETANSYFCARTTVLSINGTTLITEWEGDVLKARNASSSSASSTKFTVDVVGIKVL